MRGHWLCANDDFLFCGSFNDNLYYDFASGGVMKTTLKLNNVPFEVDFDKTEDLSFLRINTITFCGIEFKPKDFRSYDVLLLEREIFRKYLKKPLTIQNT